MNGRLLGFSPRTEPGLQAIWQFFPQITNSKHFLDKRLQKTT